jgi:hypothetical protein
MSAEASSAARGGLARLAGGMARTVGMDETLALGLAARLVTVFAAPVTLYLVVAHRPAREQGLYFIFVNAQAVAPLFEIGVGSMLVQFVSHAGVGIRADAAPGPLLPLLRAARHWYLRIVIVVGLVIWIGGVLLFWRAGDLRGSVLGSWTVLSAAVATYVFLTPALCTVEGSGGLRDVQRLRVAQAGVATLILWLAIPVLGGPTAVAIVMVGQCLLLALWLARRHGALWRAYLAPGPAAPSAREPLAGPLGRATLQWTAGFLAPQLLAPLVFAARGAAEAGRIGLSFAVATVPLTLATAWLYSRLPSYGALAAAGRLDDLDHVAVRTGLRAIVAAMLGVGGVVLLVALLQGHGPAIAARFLPLPAVAALGAASIAGIAVQALGGYLRADRDEPLAAASALSALVGVVACAVAAHRWGGSGAAAAYAAVSVAMVPVSLVLVARHRARRQLRARTA